MKYTLEEIKGETEEKIAELSRLKLLPNVLKKLVKNNGIPEYVKDLNKQTKNAESIYGIAEELAREWVIPFGISYQQEKLDAKKYVKKGLTRGFDTEGFQAEANRILEKNIENLKESERIVEESEAKEEIQKRIEKEREYTSKLIENQNMQIEALTKKIGLLSSLNDELNKRTDDLLEKFNTVNENSKEMVELLSELKTEKEEFGKNTEDIKICVESFNQGIGTLTELVNKIADTAGKNADH